MSKFLDVLKARREAAYREIYRYLPRDGEPRSFWELLREYPERQGKGLRPTLLLLTCEALGGSPEKAIKTAAAYQTFEDWVLIHDDLEDGSEQRRGKPALHHICGPSLSINTGDALHIIMWRMLLDNEPILGAESALQVMREVNRIILTTTVGQHLEMEWMRDNRINLTEADYLQMARQKAGVYTIEGPIRLGAILADAAPKLLESISQFGAPLGVAFQIQDDVLNLQGDSKLYGKEIAGDIAEGKRTLILIYLLQRISAEQRRRVDQVYRLPREQKTPEQIAEILQWMKETGSVESASQRSRELAREALGLFQKAFALVPDSQAKNDLQEAFDFVISRQL